MCDLQYTMNKLHVVTPCLSVKVKRSEQLLSKCNETIRVDKEKVRQLTDQLDTSEKQLRLKAKEFESLQVIECSIAVSGDGIYCEVRSRVDGYSCLQLCCHTTTCRMGSHSVADIPAVTLPQQS